MNRKMLILAAALSVAVSAAALGSASASSTVARPGLLPGKWQGTGVISGSVTDDGGTTTFGGKIGFLFNVRKDLLVHGKGSWVKTMTGRGFVNSDLTGIANLTFGGRSHKIVFDYIESVEGTITANGIKKPVSFDTGEDFKRASLVITKARTCTASGFIPVAKESGVKMTWTARRLGCKG
jgi:hypothetical protein